MARHVIGRLFSTLVGCAALMATLTASAQSLPVAPGPGAAAYSINIDNGNTDGAATALFWRAQLSDGKTYLLARYTPGKTGRYKPCVYDYFQVNGIESGGPNLFYTDLPLTSANSPDFCNTAIISATTLIVQPPQVYIDQLKWDPNGLFTIRFGKFNDRTQTAASLIIPARSVTGSGSGATAFNYSDAWWNLAESGWGIQIIHHVNTGGNITAAIYLYDAMGNAQWFYISGGTWNLNTFTADVYTVTGTPGGISGLTSFNAGLTKVKLVGTSSFLFTSENTLTWNYTINGVTGSKLLSRLPF